MARVWYFVTAMLLISNEFALGQLSKTSRVRIETAIQKARVYLRAKGQNENGSYTEFIGIGPTALITTALIRTGTPVSDPQIQKSLKYLEGHIKEGGGIYREGSTYRNYETCLSIMCLAACNENGSYDHIVRNADRFIKELQWGPAQKKSTSDPEYGGGGYGKHKRPDLSNTTFLIEALRASGNGTDSEALKRAIRFVSRCQNLETAYNTTPFASLVNDGGFYYTPVGEGSSQAGKSENGGLRSYGSMTYAGLKSLIYAGVKADDPRVRAAVRWAHQNYDLKSNPGLGSAGLYYYYQLFAKAHQAVGAEIVIDADGKRHDWRAELIAELVSRQRKDGSWSNENERWMEGDPNLATGYSLMALSYCMDKRSLERTKQLK